MAIDEKQLIFCVAPAITPDGPMTLMIGVTEKCWEHLKTGKTSHFSLTSVGLPFRFVLFGAADHDAAMKIIEASAANAGVPFTDARRQDFAIPELKLCDQLIGDGPDRCTLSPQHLGEHFA